MHPPETRTEFLKLRARGWSFSRIGAQLHVSKPTLITWSRQCAPQIHALQAAENEKLQQDLPAAKTQEVERLTALLNACRQELFSRQVKNLPTEAIESHVATTARKVEELKASMPSPQSNTSGGKITNHLLTNSLVR